MITVELRLNQKYYLTKRELRLNEFHLRLQYRSLQILMECINYFTKNLIYPLHFLLGKLVIFANYFVVTHIHSTTVVANVAIILGIVSTVVIWSVLLIIAGKASRYSLGTIKSWRRLNYKSKVKRIEMRMFSESCSVLSIKMGLFYPIGKSTFLKFLSMVTLGTAKALLTFQN